MKVIVWIDQGEIKLLKVDSEEEIQSVYTAINSILVNDGHSMAFKGTDITDFIKHVKCETEGWDAFEVFELAEVN